jgi:hypothetical protein
LTAAFAFWYANSMMITLNSKKTKNDIFYGGFRVFDQNGVLFEEYGINEQEATDLAIWLNGRIEHQDPDSGKWFNW